MKTMNVTVHFGAEQLNDKHPARDKARGGSGEGLYFKREVPLPENDKEVPAAIAAFNKLAEERKWDSRLDGVAAYVKAVSLTNQGEMHQRVRKLHGKAPGKTTKAGKDVSGLSEI